MSRPPTISEVLKAATAAGTDAEKSEKPEPIMVEKDMKNKETAGLEAAERKATLTNLLAKTEAKSFVMRELLASQAASAAADLFLPAPPLDAADSLPPVFYWLPGARPRRGGTGRDLGRGLREGAEPPAAARHSGGWGHTSAFPFVIFAALCAALFHCAHPLYTPPLSLRLFR